jgi:hypothetical protein
MKKTYEEGYREGFEAGRQVLSQHPEIGDGIVPRGLHPPNPYEGTEEEEAAVGWQVGLFDAID